MCPMCHISPVDAIKIDRHPWHTSGAHCYTIRHLRFLRHSSFACHAEALAKVGASAFPSRAHGDAGGAFEFAPTDPCAFDGAEDGFPDAVTEHGAINQ